MGDLTKRGRPRARKFGRVAYHRPLSVALVKAGNLVAGADRTNTRREPAVTRHVPEDYRGMKLSMLVVSASALAPVVAVAQPAETTPAPVPATVQPATSTATPTQTEPEKIVPAWQRGQRSFGLGLELGLNTGIGAALHLGTNNVGLYLAAGYGPFLISGNRRDTAKTPVFEIYGSTVVDADLYVMFARSGRASVGVLGGYSYSEFVKHGFNLGVALRYDYSSHLAFTAFGGATFLPSASDHLADRGYPMDVDPTMPWLHGGVNAGVVFYP
jgi:hypothetical protein